MSRYHDILAETAAQFGVTYTRRVKTKPNPRKNGTTERVLEAIPQGRDRARSIVEIAYKTGLSQKSVRDALNRLVEQRHAARERQVDSPRAPWRYHRVTTATVDAGHLRRIYAYLFQMRGHWLTPTQVKQALGFDKRHNTGRFLRVLHQRGAIEWHQLKARYQVRWVRKISDFGPI